MISGKHTQQNMSAPSSHENPKFEKLKCICHKYP